MNTTKDPEAQAARAAREADILADYKARGLEPLRHGADWSCARLSWGLTARGREQSARTTRETGPGAMYANGPQEVLPRFGMEYIYGNSAPYFSLTGDIREFPRQHRDHFSGGCCHETILEAFPGLAELVPWHLCDQTGTPMHYEANALFFFRNFRGLSGGTLTPSAPYKEEDRTSWLRCVLAGVFDGLGSTADADACAERLERGTAGDIVAWVRARLPNLQAAFFGTMARFRVPMMPGALEEHTLESKADGTPYVVTRDWLVPIGTDMRNPHIPYADRAPTVAPYTTEEMARFRAHYPVTAKPEASP